jgi:alpha-glucosidase
MYACAVQRGAAAKTTAAEVRPWWQEAVFYEVYLRSFQDSNGDGIGDLPGLERRLDYLRWLGVDAIWITPFYPSPQEDLGYDVSNHAAVDPAYGELADFDRVVERAHALGIRVVIDFVANHTSRRHPWFLESRADPRKRGWYFWAASRPDGSPPNDWRGQGRGDVPGGAWTWDPEVGLWYLSSFAPSQPDLNWANPEVRSAMLDVLRFWLERGVDGFRIDMVDFLGKDPGLADELLPADVAGREYLARASRQLNRPETLDHIRSIRAMVDAFEERVLIGEVIYHLPVDRFADFCGPDLLDLPTNFRLTFLPWEAEPLRRFIDRYDDVLRACGAWPNYCTANHDSPRPGRHGQDRARAIMALLLSLRGTPFIYYGDELGMTEAGVPPDARVDTWVHPDTGLGRDGARTPMQWSAEPGAGFCPPDRRPWLPFSDDLAGANVECQAGDPDSMLTLTRRLLRLRREHPALRIGRHRSLDGVAPACLAFEREAEGERLLVAANLGDEPERLMAGDGRLLLSTSGDRPQGRLGASTELAPHEAVIVQR